MMKQMKINKKQILGFCLLFILILESSGIVLAKGNQHQETALLVVVDNSGSMHGGKSLLNSAVATIQELIEKRNIEIDVEYLVFNENPSGIQKSLPQLYSGGKETGIFAGINGANEWVEEKTAAGVKVKVLFISDLFSSRYWDKETQRATEYTFGLAKTEQEEIKEIETKWKSLCDTGQMDVIVWKWKNTCKTEDSRNTVIYLEDKWKLDDDDKINGYQVQFLEDDVIDLEEGSKELDDRANCNLQLVEIFEQLIYGIEVEWEEKNVLSTQMVKKEEGQIVYICIPENSNVAIVKADENGEGKTKKLSSIVEQLYCCEEDGYGLKPDGKQKNTVYILKEPLLEWEITAFQDDSFVDGKKYVTVVVCVKPTRNLVGKEEYDCQLKQEKDGVEELIETTFVDGMFQYEFEGEKKEFVGTYHFYPIINGEKINVSERVRID